jgi:hypothetical protein
LQRWHRSIHAGLLAFSLFLVAGPALAQTQPGPLARRQIAALLEEKAGRTPAQRKLASRLLQASRMQRGLEVARGVRTLRTGVDLDARGHTLVDLRADVTPRLLARIRALGGEVVGSWPAHRSLRARLPLAGCESLAELSEVERLRPAALPVTSAADVSEGVVAHRADRVRELYGVDGTGVKVGVLSDGVGSLGAVQASGDLPTVTVLPGQAGTGTEGTAMLEIVHDIAPGAELFFATAFNGQASFAANILALRDDPWNVDVIVDDVRYFQEAVFQDDDVAQAVDAVVADGALYFSSAGNEGNLASGTSGVWEGDFYDSGMQIEGSPAHDFSAGGGAIGNLVTHDAPYSFFLQWADPQGASDNDYDFFLLDETMSSVVASSTDEQSGTQDPLELIDSTARDDEGNHVVVVLFSGQARHLHVNAFRGRLGIATDGQVAAHNAALGAISMGAVDWRDAGGAGGVFDGSEPVESFSSQGPRRIFFAPNGAPLVSEEVRSKPDLVGADCVDTATPGFNTFCGSSAAAPHGAGIAALLLEIGLGAADIRQALVDSALDIEAPGLDTLSGAGLVDALGAAWVLAPLPDVPSLGRTGLAALALALALLSVSALRAQASSRCRRIPSSRQTVP